MKKMSYSVFVAAALALTAGCAQPPQPELDSAKAAMESAVTAQAADYAPESFQAAQEANAKLEAELKTQEGASAMSRSYDEATKLAAEVKAAAEKAASEAQSGKDQMKEEVTASLGALRTSLDETKAVLAKPPRIRGLDPAALKTQLDMAEAMAGEADASMAAGRFIEAKGKVETAMAAGTAVRDALMPASAAR